MTQTAAAQIRQGRKYEQVLEGARTVFMAHGYERASVDEIARSANVSKATLYAYFPEKRLLFSEVYRVEIMRLADSAVDMLGPDMPPERALPEIGRRMLDYLTSDFATAMFRICVMETPRFPEIGQSFYENGPELGRARLGEYLQACVARGVLMIDDIDLAADQFLQLCQATIADRMICGVQKSFSEAEIARTVNGAARMFLACYAPGPGVTGR